MYGCHFFAAVLLFNGWNSVVKDLRKHSKRESAISCIEAKIKRTSPRTSYSPTSRRRSICFTESSSKFRATFFAGILVLLWFALFRFWLVHGTNKLWASGHPGVTNRKLARKKFLRVISRVFSFRTVNLHLPIVDSASLSARLFQNTSQVWLCSCGLCPFTLLNLYTAVHYKRGNKSKEGEVGFDPNAAVTLRKWTFKFDKWSIVKIFFSLQDWCGFGKVMLSFYHNTFIFICFLKDECMYFNELLAS